MDNQKRVALMQLAEELFPGMPENTLLHLCDAFASIPSVFINESDFCCTLEFFSSLRVGNIDAQSVL